MSNPHPQNPRSTFTPKSAEIPLADRPLSLTFVLPDKTDVKVSENETFDLIKVHSGQGGSDLLATFKKTEDKARVSLHGAVQDHRAQHENVWDFSVAGDASDVPQLVRNVWIAVYACESLFIGWSTDLKLRMLTFHLACTSSLASQRPVRALAYPS